MLFNYDRNIREIEEAILLILRNQSTDKMNTIPLTLNNIDWFNFNFSTENQIKLFVLREIIVLHTIMYANYIFKYLKSITMLS